LNLNSGDKEVSVTLENWSVKEVASKEKHVCTAEQKAAEACTMEYAPVCGDDGVTYGNKCSACASKKINEYTLGECPETNDGSEGAGDSGLANPAATYCIEKGGKYEIKTAADGSQYGICRINGERECEGWAYFRSNGSDCRPVTEYTVAEVLNQTCSIDQDCGTPMNYLILSHCPYTSKCLEGKCTVVCPKPFTIPGKPESFCGRSTNATCKTDSDCVKGGCSSQICQGKAEEPMITTCEYRDCYNAAAYNLSCGCDEGKCRWN
jgi:eight-cysteine-cluster-containing protein